MTEQATINRYARVLMQLSLGLIRAHAGGVSTSYVLPISAAHGVRIASCLDGLSRATVDLERFHAMLLPLFLADDVPVTGNFAHPLECLIAIVNLREDGTFEDDVPPPLAVVRYLIRAAVLFEAHTVAARDNISLEA